MKSDRWNLIDVIFQSLLEQPPEDRAAYLDEVCSGDEALRKEIEAYISYDEQTWSLLDRPAFELAAPILSQTRAILDKGQHIRHYEILDLIGVGGMGQVYLAQDTILGRKVALKLLPENFTRSDLLVERFRQEARAVSSLNHPNILTIHEIAQDANHHFIATEFIEGETLRQQMQRGRLSLNEALDIAIQAAGALAAAHQAGIIHRDIKPENIMLRTDGYVKVLDFGLAKLAEQEAPERTEENGEATTEHSSGLLMGTLRYMSPEQAKREPVDTRSDIFSFGVVLYEMLTGVPLFADEATNDLLKSILWNETTSLQHYTADIPDDLQHILNKALNRKKEERYQNIAGLIRDLEVVKDAVSRHKTDPIVESQTKAKSKGKPYRFTIVLTLTLLMIVVGAYLLTRFVGKKYTPFQSIKLAPLQITDKAVVASISHNGQVVCYVVDTGQQSLWVRDLATNKDKQLIPPVNAVIFEPFFSPDDSYIYYLKKPFRDPVSLLSRIKISGEASQEILADVNNSPDFSPDGEQIAFSAKLNKEESALIVANLKTSERQILTTCKLPEYFTPYRPAWSPDGKVIICITGVATGDRDNKIVEVQVRTGAKKVIGSRKWSTVGYVAWLANSRGLLLVAAEKGDDASTQIWHLSYPEGEFRRVTNDLHNYTLLSIVANSEKFLALRSTWLTTVWILPNGDSRRATPVTQSSQNMYRYLSWTPDGRIVYPSSASGVRDIWIMEKDGSEKRQLTADARSNLQPSVSPDNRYIIFSSNRSESGAFNIWRMNSDGSNPVQLTYGNGEIQPRCSPDGQWIFYTKGNPDAGPDGRTLWKTPIDGGEPVQLTYKTSTWPDISLDGKLIACWYKQSQDAPWTIAVFLHREDRH